jgi:hypothetical protein
MTNHEFAKTDKEYEASDFINESDLMVQMRSASMQTATTDKEDEASDFTTGSVSTNHTISATQQTRPRQFRPRFRRRNENNRSLAFRYKSNGCRILNWLLKSISFIICFQVERMKEVFHLIYNLHLLAMDLISNERYVALAYSLPLLQAVTKVIRGYIPHWTLHMEIHLFFVALVGMFGMPTILTRIVRIVIFSGFLYEDFTFSSAIGSLSTSRLVLLSFLIAVCCKRFSILECPHLKLMRLFRSR